MGLFQTHWEAHIDHNRRRLTVVRNEWTRGLTVRVDGTTVAEKAWSWIGTGHLTGLVDIEGRPARVEVRVRPASTCEILVDGQRVPATRIR